jgi:hypothetical protein
MTRPEPDVADVAAAIAERIDAGLTPWEVARELGIELAAVLAVIRGGAGHVNRRPPGSTKPDAMSDSDWRRLCQGACRHLEASAGRAPTRPPATPAERALSTMA